MPASWESDRWTDAAPEASTAAATVPRTTNIGRPESSVTTSASCQASPAGTPRAFASDSLAANRAASEATGRSLSAAANSRVVKPGVRRSADSNRATSQTSTPIPTITDGPSVSRLLDRDGLGEVPRLVDVVPLDRRELAGEQLEGNDGSERLEQRRGGRDPDQHVGVAVHRGITLLDHHDRPCPPGPDLLDAAD